MTRPTKRKAHHLILVKSEPQIRHEAAREALFEVVRQLARQQARADFETEQRRHQ